MFKWVYCILLLHYGTATLLYSPSKVLVMREAAKPTSVTGVATNVVNQSNRRLYNSTYEFNIIICGKVRLLVLVSLTRWRDLRPYTARWRDEPRAPAISWEPGVRTVKYQWVLYCIFVTVQARYLSMCFKHLQYQGIFVTQCFLSDILWSHLNSGIWI